MPKKWMSACILAWFFANAAAGSPTALEIGNADAKDDMIQLEQHVRNLRSLAQAHVADVGLAQALNDFKSHPWKRDANGLHVWGVTLSGMSWFDAGHPEIVGLDVSAMSDLEGRLWADLATLSALGSGDLIFRIVFPHPRTQQAATGLHGCFLLEDKERVLCAGGFEDPA